MDGKALITTDNAQGWEVVLRRVSAPNLMGTNPANRTKRLVRGKAKADALEYSYASRIDRKTARATAQRAERRAKRNPKSNL